MRRRQYLALLASGTATVAGCLETGHVDGGRTTTDRTTTTARSTTDRTTTTARSTTDPGPTTLSVGESRALPDGRTVAVTAASVQASVLVGGVHTDVVTPPDTQFVVVDARLAGEGVEHPDYVRPGLFDLVLDGDVNPGGHARDALSDAEGRDNRLVAFPVQDGLAPAEAAVVWSGGEGYGGPAVRWSLDGAVLDALAHPARFEVREFAVPDSIPGETAVTASVTVANRGTGDGTFRAELGSLSVSDQPEVFVDVPAGETVTRDVTVSPYVGPEAAEVEMALTWGDNRLTRTVRVE